MDRRTFLGCTAAAMLTTAGLGGPAAAAATTPQIRRRAEWASAPPTGPLTVEEDVRFVLVHHTAGPDGYRPEQVPGILDGIRAFHTGPQKRWPDIAYNLLVDRFGTVWEGREGSVDRVVRGDATGGSQGHAVLCCLLGDHRTTPPTPEAQQALVDLTAWLCHREGLDPLGQTTFVSRGSNRHPAGTQVQTPTITGHRTMSHTACPGDAGTQLVAQLPQLVADAMGPRHYRRPG